MEGAISKLSVTAKLRSQRRDLFQPPVCQLGFIAPTGLEEMLTSDPNSRAAHLTTPKPKGPGACEQQK